MAQNREHICRLCTREVSDAIDLFSTDSVDCGVADRIATVLELSLDKGDGLTGYVCQICKARFTQLERRLEVERLQAKKSHEKLATKAGIILIKESKLFFSLIRGETKLPRLLRRRSCYSRVSDTS